MRKLITKTLDCFFLLRIPLLAPVWTIVLLGWITGNPQVRLGKGVLLSGLGGNSSAALWITLAGFSLIVAAIYVANQIADIESDRINRKLFLLPHGFISVPAAWLLALVCAVSGLLISVFLGWNMALLFAASLVLGVLYDLPPASLKNRPWGGVCACFLGHGVLTYMVGWYASRIALPSGLVIAPLSTLDPSVVAQGFLASLSAGFANAAVFVTTTIPDAPGDRTIGKRTFCVAYGEKATAAAAVAFCTAALVSVVFLEYNRLVMAAPAVFSLAGFVYLAVATNKQVAFKAFKWPVFFLTALVACYVPVYGILILVTFFGSKAYYRWRFRIDYPTFKSC